MSENTNFIKFVNLPLSTIYDNAANAVIKKHMTDKVLDMKRICEEIYNEVLNCIDRENVNLSKANAIKYPKDIPEHCIALCMRKLEKFKVLNRTRNRMTGRAGCQVAVYIETGEKAGLYVTDETVIYQRMTRYNKNLTKAQMDRIYAELLRDCDMIFENEDADLIALNNGIFDYKTKMLRSFSPQYVFTRKCGVNFVYQQNGAPKITNPDGSTWDIDTWLSELTDDVETTKLLYQVIGAVIRPYVSWEKIIFLYSTVGRNGKGTFCALLRELVGDGNYTAMSIKQMTQKFAVSKLMDVIAVITDENSVNIEDVLSDASVLKAVTTHDHIQLERKYQNPVDFQFFGQIVQCINYLPQLKDITDSMKRRLLFVDFPKTFTGCDNKLIKSEYLHRKDVLEYILWEVLVKIPDYYEFDIPAASERLLHTYELRNDNVKDFWCDMSPQLVWNICPGGFLYDLYKAWIDRNEPRGTVMGRNAFYAHLRQIVLDDDDWYAATSSIPIPKNAVCPPEPLILKYNLTDWMCDDYKGGNVDVRCTPTLPSSISSAFICTGTTFEDVEEEEDDVPFRNDTTDSDSET